MNSKILFGIILLAAIGGSGFLLLKKNTKESECPKDRMPCPDGSTVGRQGAACDFASCSGDTGEWLPIDAPEGQVPITSGDDLQPGSAVHDLPIPEAVAAVKRHIAEKAGVEPRQVLVLEAHERNWPDACLGLPQTEQMCAQVITPGYEVRAQAAGRSFHFRTNSDGTVLVQESEG